MLEITWLFLIATALFYILAVLFKADEFNYLSLLASVIGVACVLLDTEIAGTYLAMLIIPLFYVVCMSVVHIIFGRGMK